MELVNGALAAYILSPATAYVDVHGTYCRRTAYIVAGDNICQVLRHILSPAVTYCHSFVPLHRRRWQYMLGGNICHNQRSSTGISLFCQSLQTVLSLRHSLSPWHNRQGLPGAKNQSSNLSLCHSLPTTVLQRDYMMTHGLMWAIGLQQSPLQPNTFNEPISPVQHLCNRNGVCGLKKPTYPLFLRSHGYCFSKLWIGIDLVRFVQLLCQTSVSFSRDAVPWERAY